jgi:hypothetical protein
MPKVNPARRAATAACALLVLVLAIGVSRAGAAGTLVAYNLYPLISDGAAVTAPAADGSLVNGWGLSASATSPWWTTNNGTNTSTLYNGLGAKNTNPTMSAPDAGTVANPSTTEFQVSQSGVTAAARFLFSNMSGQILGWSPTVNGTAAVVAADNSPPARGTRPATTDDRPYATDFHNGASTSSTPRSPVALAGGFT